MRDTLMRCSGILFVVLTFAFVPVPIEQAQAGPLGAAMRTTADPAPRIRSFALVSPGSGWVLSDRHLLWTGDGGKTWRVITPPNFDAATIRSVYFLSDSASGWLVASGRTESSGATPLLIFSTTDAGNSWTAQQLARADRRYTDSFSGPAHIQFLDRQRGWVVIRLTSSANFSLGQLFSTGDGDATWKQLSVPTGDPVAFVNSSFDWNAGGPVGDRLSVTRDGGQTWQKIDVSIPAEFAYSLPSYALPRFQDDRVGVLPVTFAGGDRGPSAAGFYTSLNGGQRWQLTITMPLQEKIEAGGRAHAEVIDSQTWIVVPQEGGQVVRTVDSGGSYEIISSPDLPDGVTRISFATPSTGWAQVTVTSCAAPTTGCLTTEQLLQTTDGGQHWLSLRQCFDATGQCIQGGFLDF